MNAAEKERRLPTKLFLEDRINGMGGSASDNSTKRAEKSGLSLKRSKTYYNGLCSLERQQVAHSNSLKLCSRNNVSERLPEKPKCQNRSELTKNGGQK